MRRPSLPSASKKPQSGRSESVVAAAPSANAVRPPTSSSSSAAASGRRASSVGGAETTFPLEQVEETISHLAAQRAKLPPSSQRPPLGPSMEKCTVGKAATTVSSSADGRLTVSAPGWTVHSTGGGGEGNWELEADQRRPLLSIQRNETWSSPQGVSGGLSAAHATGTVRYGASNIQYEGRSTGGWKLTIPKSIRPEGIVAADLPKQCTAAGSFTHGGDESVSRWTIISDETGGTGKVGSSSAPRRSVTSASGERQPTVARSLVQVDLMDGCARYDGEAAASAFQFDGRGTLSIPLRPATGGANRAVQYDGSWAAGQRSGEGTWTVDLSTAGSKLEYKGGWLNDCRHGAKGTLTFTAGGGAPLVVVVESGWKKGKLDGPCHVSLGGERVVSCAFDEGKLLSDVTIPLGTGTFTAKWASAKDAAVILSRLGQNASPLSKVDFTSEGQAAATAAHRCASSLLAIRAVTFGVQQPLQRSIKEQQAAASAAAYLGELATTVRAMEESSKQRMASEAARNAAKGEQSKKQTQLNQLKEKVAGRERDIATLESELEAKQKSLAAASKQRAVTPPPPAATEAASSGADLKADLNSQIKELSASKTAHEATLAQLQKDLQGLQADLKKVQQRRDTMTKEIASLQSETVATTAKLAPLQEQLAASAARTTQLEGEAAQILAKGEATRKPLQDMIADLQRKLREADGGDSGGGSAASDGTIEARREDIVRLRGELEGHRVALSQAEEDSTKLQEELRTTKGQRTRREAHIGQLRSTLDSIQAEASTMQESVSVQKAALRKVQRLLDDAKAQQSSAVSTTTTSESNKKDGEMLERLKEETDELRSNNEGHRVAIEHLEQQLQTLQAQRVSSPPPAPPASSNNNNSDATMIAALEAKKKEMDERHAHLQKKAQTLQQRTIALEEQKAGLLRDLEEAQRQKKLRSPPPKAASEKIDMRESFDGSVAELKTLLQRMKKENEQYEGEVADLRRVVAEAQKELDEAKRKKSPEQNHNNNNNGADWRMRALQEEVDARESRIGSLRAELRRVTQLEAKIESAKDTLRTLTQRAELRQNTAATMARADMEWSASVNLARRASSGRASFF